MKGGKKPNEEQIIARLHKEYADFRKEYGEDNSETEVLVSFVISTIAAVAITFAQIGEDVTNIYSQLPIGRTKNGCADTPLN